MNFIKKILLSSIFLLLLNISYAKMKVPLVVHQQDKIFSIFLKDIENFLPRGIRIFAYNLFLLNGSEEIESNINESFCNVFLNDLEKNRFFIDFENNLELSENEMDISFIENHDEIELIAFGDFLEMDAVIISSVTIIEKKEKKVWDKEKGKYLTKSVALFQGNIFNTQNNSSMFRFFYYFLID